MADLAWKMRISVLWIFLAVSMSALALMYLMESGVIEEIIAGKIDGIEISGGLLMVYALIWLVPLIMAFLTLILKDKTNRYTNAVLGLLWAFLGIFDIADHLSKGYAFGGFGLMGVAKIVVALLIFWHAWKWPTLKPLKAG